MALVLGQRLSATPQGALNRGTSLALSALPLGHNLDTYCRPSNKKLFSDFLGAFGDAFCLSRTASTTIFKVVGLAAPYFQRRVSLRDDETSHLTASSGTMIGGRSGGG